MDSCLVVDDVIHNYRDFLRYAITSMTMPITIIGSDSHWPMLIAYDWPKMP